MSATSPLMSPLEQAVADQLKAPGTPPVWSLIVTIFGDALLPRGGVASTAGLIRLLALFGIAAPAARTALHRLVADGWLESVRDGRRSFHRVTAAAEAESLAASRRIYRSGSAETEADIHAWDVAVALNSGDRSSVRPALAALGFGLIEPGLFVRPAIDDRETILPHGVALIAGGQLQRADAHAFTAAAYDLPALGERWRNFSRLHEPLLNAIETAASVQPEDAIRARILLIHNFRRLVLRDPALPLALLPADWPGRGVTGRVAAAYRQLAAPSEAWLSREIETLDGPLPPAPAAIGARFGLATETLREID